MNIHQTISRNQVDFECETGKKPTRVYLGRNEMKALLLWAYDNQYISSPNVNVEGDHRPEVNGLLCWQVNDDDHLACA